MQKCNKVPNFFVVGTAKAGTSSVGYYLSQHPEIYISPIKEPHFFSKDIRMADFRPVFRRLLSFDVTSYLNKYPLPQMHIAHIENESQYLQLFREVKNEKAIGELSTGYLYSSGAAENLFNFNPSAKIVMILRQPVMRAYSHYLMNIRDFWDVDSGFVDALERDFTSRGKGWGKSHLYIELGMYFDQVRRYLACFPPKQVKIILYEDLKANPVGVMNALFEFFEVDSSKLSAIDLSVHKNSAKLPRFKVSDRYLDHFNIFKTFIGSGIPYNIKKQIWGVMFSDKNIPRLKQDEFKHAMEYFKEDIQKLSDLINIDLQDWHQMRE